MVSFKEALQKILSNCQLLSVKKIKTENAVGYFLSENIVSPMYLPPFNQSAMDGYAIQYKDYTSGQSISVIGEIAAGEANPEILINSGEAYRIYTGAPVPKGADVVVVQEKVTEQGGHIIITDTNLIKGANIRLQGSQVKPGNIAITAGIKLNAGTIGYIANMGIEHVNIFEKPKVSILVTGNELSKPGQLLGYGQIYESNSYALTAALNALSIHPISVDYAVDNRSEISRQINNAIKNSDILLISGGISVGKYDFVGECLKEIGVENIFYKVKQKPGKPMFFGRLQNKLVFALPGNPASVLSCFYEYVYPAIMKLQGAAEPFLQKICLPISCNYVKKSGLTHFLKARIENYSVIPLEGQESYILSSFIHANAFIYLPEEKENIQQGEMVEVHILPT